MATVTFIRYKSQSAGALHRVAGYVSQKQKTEQEDGWQLVSGQNCTPQLAAQEFIATRQMHRKDSPIWFYHYVQSFSPDEEITGALAHQVAQEFAQQAWPTRTPNTFIRISLSIRYATEPEKCSARDQAP